MNTRSCIAALSVLLLCAPIMAGAQILTACDWEVGHPSDPHLVGPGKSSSDVDTVKAMAACREALEADPDNPRFHYQMGRALVYHANRTDGSLDEGMKHLAISAEAGYTQAMFVYALMLKSQGERCALEPWTRRAADDGLKAARIAYLDNWVTGLWEECRGTAGPDQLQADLAAVSVQVTGYYENVLFGALKRELNRKLNAGDSDE